MPTAPAHLAAVASLVYGDRWQRALARALGAYHPDGPRRSIDDRLVRRWAAGERLIPAWVWPALDELTAERRRDLERLANSSQPQSQPAAPAASKE